MSRGLARSARFTRLSRTLNKLLFYGPSGTGKTLTAALIGKKMGKPVYRIDLSRLVSKYVGETEKNLENIFHTARRQDWILFFDEAEALFAKRTNVNSANDRFANQETAYLLQRMETCGNMVILASNLKANIDKAYTRRFQSIINFPLPGEKERLHLWKTILPENLPLDEEIDLADVAKKYNISGGSIVNVIRYAVLMTTTQKSDYLSYKDFMEGMKKEYTKEGRTLVLK